MKDLLRGCFAPSEADRPHDFGVVETGLLKIYESVTGHPYPRPQPNAADNTADNLNNHALSFIDIGKPEEAERCWEEALALMPNHAESIYNQSIHRWKKGEIDDMETVRILTSKISNADYHLGMLHLARADAESAIACLKKAIQAGGETDDIKKALAVAQEMKRKEQYPCCIRTFQRHTKSVYSVCFSPDGKRMLSENRERMLSEDGFYDNYSLELWDAETGNWISTFWGGHTSRVFSVCFSPDGKRALSGSSDKTLKLWDAQTGKCIRTFNGHTNDVYSVCFSPDGKWALSGSSDHTLKLWDTETGECIRTFQGHTNIVCSVCFNPDGQLALSGSDDHTLKLWYTETGECIHTFQGHTHFVRSVCFNPDGRQALSGSWDKTLKLWDIQTGKCIRTFRDWVVYSVCFSPDGRRALSGGEDTTLKLWNTQTGECIRTFQGHADFVRSVCFSPDGRWALSGSEDKTLKLWRLPDKEGACEYTLSRIHSTEITLKQAEHFASLAAEINKLIKNRQIVQALVKLEDLKAVRLFGDNQVYYALTNALKRYCMISSCATNQVSQIGSGATSLCFSPDGRLALSGSSDYTLKLWDTETGECIRTFQGHIAKVLSICFSPNGQRALSGSLDRTLMLWDAQTGACLRTFKGHTEGIESVCFSPDGQRALSGSWDKTLKLWDAQTGACLRTFKGHTDAVKSVCFSPDGRRALSGSRDKTLKLWGTQTGACLRTFQGHTNWVYSVCFSPDGRRALSGSEDKTLKLWDTRTGKCLRTFQGHDGSVLSVCFSPDGQRALSGSGDNTLKLWDIQTGECIYTFKGHTSYVPSVCFSPDGNRIASASDKNILIHDLEYDLRFPGWADWDEGAQPYLEIFLTLHPNWTDEDFEKILIPELQHRGYGWLRPEGVRAQLERYGSQNKLITAYKKVKKLWN
jgi:WD40 repeat protein